MPKKFIFPIILLVILLLSFPRPASAQLGTGIFDFFESALSGIEELAGPVAKYVVAFFFTYLIGLLGLNISVVLLQKATDPALLSLQGNPLIDVGWHFTVGIANMFIIIILLYIAFSFILKIENQQMRKALPRLILVAILLNFSLLFISMIVDMGNITTNTFLKGNEDLPSKVTQSLGLSSEGVFKSIGGWLGAMAALFIIPFSAPFVQYGLVTLFATILASNIVPWIFQIIAFFIISIIFLIYAVLFIARVFIIQLLAIIAPLAFLALILPQTKKYWDKWLNLLLEWVFLGVVLFFFMTLGLTAVHALIPAGGEFPWPIQGVTEFPQYFIYYLYLVIFLIVALWLSKKTMPTFAQAVIDQAVGLGKMAWGRVALPLGGAAKERLQQFAASQKKREDELAATKARGEKVKISPLRGFTMGAGRYMRRGIEGAHWAAGTTVSAAMASDLNKKTEEYEKRYGKDFVGAAKNFSNLRTDRDRAAMTLYLEKTKGGKALGELTELKDRRAAVNSLAKYAPYRVEDIVKHMPELIKDETMMSTIQGAMMSKGLKTETDEKTGEVKFEDKDLQKMKESGIKIDGKSIDELVKTDAGKIKAIRAALYKKAVDAAKNEDIENMTDSTLSDSDYQEAVARYKNISFIRRIGEEKGSANIQNIRIKAERDLRAEEIAKTNATLLYSTVTNPGFSSIFPAIKGAANTEEIDSLVAKARGQAVTPKTKLTPGTEEEFRKALRGREEREKGKG